MKKNIVHKIKLLQFFCLFIIELKTHRHFANIFDLANSTRFNARCTLNVKRTIVTVN